MMYIFEYFVYHLKPFGYESKILLPSEKYRPEVNAPKGGKAHSVTEIISGKTKGIKPVEKTIRASIKDVPSKKDLSPNVQTMDRGHDRSANNASVFHDPQPRTRVKLVPRYT